MKKAAFAICVLFAASFFFFWHSTEYTDPPSMNDRLVSVDCVAPAPSETFFRPGCDGKYHLFAKAIPFHTNQLGLRDRDYPPFPPKGTTRILYLGDSTVWGSGLEDAQTIPRRLEAELLRRGGRIEVINGASLAALPEELFHSLPGLLEAYHPQIVLLHMNGGQEIRESVWHPFLGPDGRRHIYRAEGIWAGRRTHFVNGLRAAWSGFQVRYRAWWKAKRVGSAAALEELTAPTLQNFLLAKATISSHGAEPIVVSINQAPTTTVIKPLFARIFAPFFQLSPVTTFPLAEYEQLPAYRALSPIRFSKDWPQLFAAHLLLPDKSHLTPEGAEQLARELADQLWARWYPSHR